MGCLVKSLISGLGILLLAGCTGIPEGTVAVRDFELQRYLGQWYEIARLDHSFERGLTRVSANYSMREDGGVDVLNRGYDASEQQWQTAQGRAYILESPDIGRLKVSFWGPLYSSYNIIALDKKHYQYAMVCGFNHEYLWILSRQPELGEGTRQKLLEQAQRLGFAVENLIWVEHSGHEAL